MKTLKQIFMTLQGKSLKLTVYLFTLCLISTSCAKNDDSGSGQQPIQSGTVTGFVKDDLGNPYPSTIVRIKKGTDEIERATNSDGIFTIATHDVGNYTIEIELPLATQIVGNAPSTVNVIANQTSTVNFNIAPMLKTAHVNFGNVQVIEEIKDVNGSTPVAPSEPLYAANIFDPPLGTLYEIKAPDNHHVVLSEFQEANGNLFVRCNGTSSTVEISLEGMIPGGTYTFWLAYLNKIKHVGESIDFMNDFVFPTNPPLGSGIENVVIADANGTIQKTITHSSCVLTDQVALVIPIVYHLNGNTYGSGHIPDEEDATHMLVYFQ